MESSPTKTLIGDVVSDQLRRQPDGIVIISLEDHQQFLEWKKKKDHDDELRQVAAKKVTPADPGRELTDASENIKAALESLSFLSDMHVSFESPKPVARTSFDQQKIVKHDENLSPKPGLSFTDVKRDSSSSAPPKKRRLVRSDSLLPHALGVRRKMPICKSMPQLKKVSFEDRPRNPSRPSFDMQSEPGSFGRSRRFSLTNEEDLQLPTRLSLEGYDRGRSIYAEFDDYDEFATPPNSTKSVPSSILKEPLAGRIPKATEKIPSPVYFDDSSEELESDSSSGADDNRKESMNLNSRFCCLSKAWLRNILTCGLLPKKRGGRHRNEKVRKFSSDRKRPMNADERDRASDSVRLGTRRVKSASERGRSRWLEFLNIILI